MTIGYLIHDLTDPAVERRVRMLSLGGADLILAGFRRSDRPVPSVAGVPAFDLGRTYDARLAHRAMAAGIWALQAGRLAELMAEADTILARNLETLLLAVAMRGRMTRPPALVYECLDVHRAMVGAGSASAVLRMVERRLMEQVRTVVVSSPAFLKRYFEPRQGLGRAAEPRALLVENKVLVDGGPAPGQERRPDGPPWRILWPGIIRCRRSLETLRALALRRPDLVRITLRGRPTTAVFPDLAAELQGVQAMTYDGTFEDDELPGLYRQAHFTWAVDWFDEGLNSSWLLPNRIYQSGYFGSVPIALRQVEIGRWLDRHGLGVLFDDPGRQLEHYLDRLTPERYAELEARSDAAPRALFCFDRGACGELVEALTA